MAWGRRSWFLQEMRDRAETPAPPGSGKESIQRSRFSGARRAGVLAQFRIWIGLFYSWEHLKKIWH